MKTNIATDRESLVLRALSDPRQRLRQAAPPVVVAPPGVRADLNQLRGALQLRAFRC